MQADVDDDIEAQAAEGRHRSEQPRVEDRVVLEVGPLTAGSQAHHAGSAVGRCHGAVIIGTPQMESHQGLANPGSPDVQPVNDVLLSAAWNQIEAGMSAMRNQPLFVDCMAPRRCLDFLDDGADVVQNDHVAARDLTEME